jgi:hypothetical protein
MEWKLKGRVRLDFESGENELAQQEIAMANSFEPLEVEVYL